MSEQQLSLLDYKPPLPNIHFSGATYDAAFDCDRLNKQQRRVHDVMIDGGWRTLREIEDATGDPQASISARLRDFNNHQYFKRFFVMEHRRRGEQKRGIWEYRVYRRDHCPQQSS
jgi:hypothetical protein